MNRVEKVKKFVSKYVKAGKCKCCNEISLLRFKFGKIKICVSCLKTAIHLMGGGSDVISIDTPKQENERPIRKLVKLSEEEIAEMQKSSKIKKPKDGFDWGEQEQ